MWASPQWDVVYQLDLLKGVMAIPEPQYETDEYYAVTAFAETIDEVTKTIAAGL